MSELCFTPATELARQIAARELSPVELVDAVLVRIEATAPQLNAFCLLRADEARHEAVEAEKPVADGTPLGPLHGIPISIKDLTSTKGIRTTFGSHAYADNVPDVDAVFVTRLREAGAILLGKTNTPEFGNKGVTDSPLHGTTANPWALDHTAGGSSGGAAAAVAAGLGPLAEGSDGAGSIRIPASCCGVVGYKPSFGRVPMYPRNGYHTISHHGPLTRTVADAALMLSVMAGPDARDPHVRTDPPADYLEAVREPDIAGWTVGFSADLGNLPVEPAIREAVTKAAAAFDDLGANLDDDVPALPDARDPMAVIWRVVFEAIVRVQIRPAVAPDQMDPHLRELAAAGERIDAAAYYEAGEDGLPIGLQIVGRPGADEDVLRAAAAFQAATGFERHRPPLSGT